MALCPVVQGHVKKSAALFVLRHVHRGLLCSRPPDAVALLSIIRDACADSVSIVPSTKSSYALFFLNENAALC